MDGSNGGAVFNLIDRQGNPVSPSSIGWTTTYRKFNTKSQADIASARIRTWKSKINTQLKKSNTDKQVMSYLSGGFRIVKIQLSGVGNSNIFIFNISLAEHKLL